MLSYSGMYRRPFSVSILAGVAFLVVIPNVAVVAGALRDEAVSYRDEGFALQRQGDKAGALAFYQKATNLNPAYPVPWNDAGILLEEAGRFEDTLFYLASFYEAEVDSATKSMTTIIEPLLLIVIGIVVGGLALAIITPIYQITGNIRR